MTVWIDPCADALRTGPKEGQPLRPRGQTWAGPEGTDSEGKAPPEHGRPQSHKNPARPDSVVADVGSRPSAECGGFPGLDTRLARVHVPSDELDEVRVTLLSTLAEVADSDVLDSLRHCLDRRFRRCRWLVDVSGLPQLELPLLDALLRAGRQADAKGDCLVLVGLRRGAVASPFLEPFLDRCREMGVVVADDGAAEPPCSALPQDLEGFQK